MKFRMKKQDTLYQFLFKNDITQSFDAESGNKQENVYWNPVPYGNSKGSLQDIYVGGNMLMFLWTDRASSAAA